MRWPRLYVHLINSDEIPLWAKRHDHKLNLIHEGLMATKQEVKADLEELKTEVAEMRGAANSAITMLRGFIDTVGEAAANAKDLDEFRADLALIKSESMAAEDALKAAVVTNPVPPGEPEPPLPPA